MPSTNERNKPIITVKEYKYIIKTILEDDTYSAKTDPYAMAFAFVCLTNTDISPRKLLSMKTEDIQMNQEGSVFLNTDPVKTIPAYRIMNDPLREYIQSLSNSEPGIYIFQQNSEGKLHNSDSLRGFFYRHGKKINRSITFSRMTKTFRYQKYLSCDIRELRRYMYHWKIQTMEDLKEYLLIEDTETCQEWPEDSWESLETKARYSDHIERMIEQVHLRLRSEFMTIREDFDNGILCPKTNPEYYTLTKTFMKSMLNLITNFQKDSDVYKKNSLKDKTAEGTSAPEEM